jgi:hypothetical protein
MTMNLANNFVLLSLLLTSSAFAAQNELNINCNLTRSVIVQRTGGQNYEEDRTLSKSITLSSGSMADEGSLSIGGKTYSIQTEYTSDGEGTGYRTLSISTKIDRHEVSAENSLKIDGQTLSCKIK